MAEIGVGNCRMASVLARAPKVNLILVDSFLTEEKQPEAYRATRDTFAQRTAERARDDLKRAQDLARSRAGIVLLHMDSVDAARRIEDGSLDLVFIDADHSYQGCKTDIAAWLPKIKRGGWLGGHDYHNHDPRYDFSGVDRAVDEFAINFGVEIETDANFTWWVRR